MNRPWNRTDVWPLPASKDTGSTGEHIAGKFLARRGLKILARNYRCPVGEADLVALDKSTRKDAGCDTLVFVEVKTRGSDYFTDPEFAVDSDKQRRLRKIAEYYLSRHDADELNVRFDIVAIVMGEAAEKKPRIKYIPDAF